MIEEILYARGIKNIDRFLNPDDNCLNDWRKLKNIKKAIETVKWAINKDKKIGILADTDNDGCTSGSIMFRYLSHFKSDITMLLNQNKVHGLTGQDIDYLKTFNIIIACDSLSSEESIYKELQDNNVTVVILDHHPISENADKYAIIVNSTRNYPNDQLSGAGVTLQFCRGLDSALQCDYSNQYYDLAACGIISDRMLLDENHLENRYICKHGFENLVNPGIKEVIGKYQFNSEAVSFSIAPYVNACVRQNLGGLAIQLFTIDDKKEIKKIVSEIKEIKKDQNKEIEKELNNLQFQVRTMYDLDKDKVIIGVVDHDTNHSGLLAQKLASQYSRPAIVIHKDTRYGHEGNYLGSLRSIGVDNFRDIVNSTKYGKAFGHSMAAGVSIYDIDKFKREINERLKDTKFIIHTNADANADINSMNVSNVQKIQFANKITGNGFPEINFVFRQIIPNNVIIMASKHTKIQSVHGIDFIFWNQNLTSELNRAITIDILGSPSINIFKNKKTVQVIGQDIKYNYDKLPFAL